MPARIRKGFCDGPLREIEHVGKTERHEIAGKTSEVLNALVEKLFHLAWDVDRVPYRFHKQSVSHLIAFVKKLRVPTHAPPKSSAATIPIVREITRIPSASLLSANHLTAKIVGFVSPDQVLAIHEPTARRRSGASRSR